MFNNRKSDTPLYLKAHALNENQVIAEALNQIPDICKQLRAIGWKLAIEELPGDLTFYQDTLAFALARNANEGRQMMLDFVALLDANAQHIAMADCMLQAWIVDEFMDKRVRNLTVHWSRQRATENPKVVPLFPANRLSIAPIAT